MLADEFGLWKATINPSQSGFSMSQWTFINYNGAENPGPREEATTWVQGGELFLLGGSDGARVRCNYDIWKFTFDGPASGLWSPVRTGTFFNSSGNFTAIVSGAPGAENPSYHPPGLCAPATKIVGNFLYVFGGLYSLPSGGLISWNDMWRLNLSNFQWAFMKGSQAPNMPSSWFYAGYEADDYLPLGVAYAQMFYVSSRSALVVWGGENPAGLSSEMWVYYIPSNRWAIVPGHVGYDYAPVYSTADVRKNLTAGHVSRPAAWQTPDGKFWIQGGFHRLLDQGAWSHVWALSMTFFFVNDGLLPAASLHPAAYSVDSGVEFAYWHNRSASFNSWAELPYVRASEYFYDKGPVVAQKILGVMGYPGYVPFTSPEALPLGYRGYVWNFASAPRQVMVRILQTHKPEERSPSRFLFAVSPSRRRYHRVWLRQECYG